MNYGYFLQRQNLSYANTLNSLKFNHLSNVEQIHESLKFSLGKLKTEEDCAFS